MAEWQVVQPIETAACTTEPLVSLPWHFRQSMSAAVALEEKRERVMMQLVSTA
jgi:hypothetical protein